MAFPSFPPLRGWRATSGALVAVVLIAGLAPGAASAVQPAEDESTPSAPTLPALFVSPVTPVLSTSDEDAVFSVVVRNPGDEPLAGGEISLELNPQRVETMAGLEEEFPVSGSSVATARIGETAADSEQTITVTVARDDLPLFAGTSAGVYQLRGTLTPDADSEPRLPNFGDTDAADSHDTDSNDTDSNDTDSNDTDQHDAETGDAEAGDTASDDTAVSSDDTAVSSDAAFAEDGALHSATVPIVWRGTGGSEVKLSVIVPFVLPSEIRTLPTRDQLSEAVPRLDRLLTAATAERATLAIDPRIIAAIRAYGDESPPEAQRLLSRLESSSLPGFLLQFADADPAAQAALGFTTLLEPTNLDFISRYGTFSETTFGGSLNRTGAEDNVAEDADSTEDSKSEGDSEPATSQDSNDAANSAQSPTPTPTATLTPTPTPTPTPERDSTVLPTLSELLAWPEETPTAWPAEGSVDEGTLELLDANDISTWVLTSDNVTQEGGPRAKIRGGDALITDAALGSAARTALSAATDTERSAAISEISARLALAAQTEVPGIILGMDRGAMADAENPEELLTLIGELDWVAPTVHTEQTPGSASLKSADTLEERRELLRTAVNRESAVDEVGAILVHPEYLSGYQRTRLLDLFATRYAAPDADFPDAAASFRKRDAELMEGVRAISTEHTQLVGASTRVPVQLRNSLPFEALLSVRVDPASAALTLPERSFADVRVRAEGTERLLVPVQSRVSSGESGLVVTVSDASGDLTIYTGTLSISIRSSVETIALWSLGVLAALLLGFGIWRSVRRRQHREDESAPVQA